MDDLLATHFAHLFIRDPLVVFSEDLQSLDLDKTDHFENLQSTNWQHMRFKPPPHDKDTGWRVEFRPMEIQITDFENAAFSVFLVLITRAILSFDLNFYIPIAKVTENMQTAHRRDAVLDHKFYFRKKPLPERRPHKHSMSSSSLNLASNGGGVVGGGGRESGAHSNGVSTPHQYHHHPSRPPSPLGPVEEEYCLMTIDEIINGVGQSTSSSKSNNPQSTSNHPPLYTSSSYNPSGLTSDGNHPSSTNPSSINFSTNSIINTNNPSTTPPTNSDNHPSGNPPINNSNEGHFPTTTTANEVTNNVTKEHQDPSSNPPPPQDSSLDDNENEFPGLIPLVESYLDSMNIDVSTRCELNRYLELIRLRASGELWTPARWIRQYVRTHEKYKGDSVVNEDVEWDLVRSVERIGCGEGRIVDGGGKGRVGDGVDGGERMVEDGDGNGMEKKKEKREGWEMLGDLFDCSVDPTASELLGEEE